MTIQTPTTTSTPSRPAPPQGIGLDGTGFHLASTDTQRRIILSIEGDWGTGKTDLALTAPAPIAFFKLDLNAEFTLAKYAATKKIYVNEVAVPKHPDAKEAQRLAEAAWAKFQLDYAKALASTHIRTVIWDTATEVWELCRLEAFGKISQVQPQHYTQVNNAFRALIKAAFDSNTNLILVHRLKDKWESYSDSSGRERNKKTGEKERAGFGDLGFAVQVMVQCYFEPEEESPFAIKVLKCTQNPRLTGKIYRELPGLRMNSFPILASEVFPGTDYEKDWS